MKRTSVLALSLLVTTAAFAADTQRYLVGTRAPLKGRVAAAVKQMVGEEFEKRDVKPFESFVGFAADLTEGEVAALRESSDVRFVERVVPRYKLEQERNPLRQTIPLGVNSVFARQAQAGTAKATINVVVIDTGVDYRHSELKDVYAGGWNTLNRTDDPLDDEGHGTHVAGTIAAADNDIGVVGVAPHVRLWSVKCLNERGSGSNEHLAEALQWTINKKNDLGGNWVVNISLGSYEDSIAEREAITRTYDAGILIVAAAGNNSTETKPAPVTYPGAYPEVVTVAAATYDRQHAYFSAQGPEIDLSAPGVGVLSTTRLGTNDSSFIADEENTTFVTELIGSKRGIIEAEYVYCGLGKQGEFPASVAGKIALIQRGEITFSEKTRRAKEAGAVGVAIFDNVDESSSSPWTLYSNEEDKTYDWPLTLQLTKQAGLDLVEKGPRAITIAFMEDSYEEMNGTSMASPHVAGAAALLWSLAPDASAQQIVNALKSTAVDLGPIGPDPLFGVGFINVFEAAKMLAPETFGGISTGRPIGQRGRR